MKETRFAYVAGLIDADGSLYISKAVRKDGHVNYDPIIMVRTTHLPTAKWLAKTFGGTIDRNVWSETYHKDYYRWKFTSDKHASRFLDRVAPYLWLKEKQATVLKSYYALKGTQIKGFRELLFTKMAALNQNLSVTTNTSRLSLKGKNRQAYFAGMFDGEGSAYIIRVRQSVHSRGKGFYYRGSVCLGSTCERLSQELQQTYGGATRKRPPHNGILAMYEWVLNDNKRKETFLLSIIPYLVTKRQQAVLVLGFSRMNGSVQPDRRKKMWLDCSELNGNKRESDLIGDYESAPVVTQAA